MRLEEVDLWPLCVLSVQSAVIKVFQGGALQTNELYTLNESIRWPRRLRTQRYIHMFIYICTYISKSCDWCAAGGSLRRRWAPSSRTTSRYPHASLPVSCLFSTIRRSVHFLFPCSSALTIKSQKVTDWESYTRTNTRTDTRTNKCTNTRTDTRTNTRTNTWTNTHTNKRTNTRMSIYLYIYINTIIIIFYIFI